jgi:Mannosyltransferase (PIG-V)
MDVGVAGSPVAGATTSVPVSLRRGVRFSLLVFLVARLTVSLLGVVGVDDHQLSGRRPDLIIAPTPGWHNAIDGTFRWDAPWFREIATQGYRVDDESAAFFPVYPVSIRALSAATGLPALDAGLVISNLAFVAALIVLYALTTLEYDEQVARRSSILLAFFPTAFFFLAPYSESVYLLASVLSFWWARRNRWALAGVSGAVAAATRNLGFLLAVPLLIEATRQYRVDPEGRRSRLIWACLPVVGALSYAVYWVVRTGDPLRPIHAQGAWLRQLSFPIVTLGHGFAFAVQGITDRNGVFWTVDFLLACAVLIPLAVGWRLLDKPYLAYAIVGLGVPLCFTLTSRPLVSYPRYSAVIFPVFWIVANWLRDRRAMAWVTALSFAGYSALAVAFMNWRPIF